MLSQGLKFNNTLQWKQETQARSQGTNHRNNLKNNIVHTKIKSLPKKLCFLFVVFFYKCSKHADSLLLKSKRKQKQNNAYKHKCGQQKTTESKRESRAVREKKTLSLSLLSLFWAF